MNIHSEQSFATPLLYPARRPMGRSLSLRSSPMIPELTLVYLRDHGNSGRQFQDGRNMPVLCSLIESRPAEMSLFNLCWSHTKPPVLLLSHTEDIFCTPRAAVEDWFQSPDSRKMGVHGYLHTAYT